MQRIPMSPGLDTALTGAATDESPRSEAAHTNGFETQHAPDTHAIETAARSVGFARLTPERRREIGRLGGRAAHSKGSAYRFRPENARDAGSKGGRASHALGKAPRFTTETGREAGRRGGASVSQDREHMSRIGRLGAARRLSQRKPPEA